MVKFMNACPTLKGPFVIATIKYFPGLEILWFFLIYFFCCVSEEVRQNVEKTEQCNQFIKI